jgi:hypothetical protein
VWVGGVDWQVNLVVECLPSMHRTLGSFPETVKKKLQGKGTLVWPREGRKQTVKNTGQEG